MNPSEPPEGTTQCQGWQGTVRSRAGGDKEVWKPPWVKCGRNNGPRRLQLEPLSQTLC